MSTSFTPTWSAIGALLTAAHDVVAQWETGDLAEAVRNLDAAIQAFDSPEIRASDAERAAAEEIHGSDEVEIDSDALVSHADDGYWVSASVWVPVEPSEQDEEG